MAALFPSLYPEEPIFSAIARHAEAMGFSEEAILCRDIYGTHMAIPASNIPGELALLARHLPPGHPYTPWSLLRDHTPLPYYLPFYPARAQRPFVENLWSDSPETNAWGWSAVEAGPVPESLRFCQECVASDVSAGAPPVWRRSHQLPGVIVCPVHSAPLLHTRLRYVTKEWPLDLSFGGLRPLEAVTMEGGWAAPLDAASQDFALRVAQDSLWLLQHWQGGESRGSVLTRLHATLVQRDLATESGRVDYVGVERILAQLPTGFVMAAYRVPEHYVRWTIPRLMDGWRGNQPLAPLDLLVVIRALGVEVKEFFRGPPPRVQLPRRGWALVPGPCVNPHCERLAPKSALAQHRRWLRVAVVHCHACGTAYAERIGHSGRRFIKLGGTWEAALQAQLLDPPSLPEAARQLRLTPGRLAAEAIRLRSWPATWPKELRALAFAPTELTTPEQRKQRTRVRWYWNRFLRRANRDLRYFGPEAWDHLRWLLRHDPAWLSDNFVSAPPPPPPPTDSPIRAYASDGYWVREFLDKVRYLQGWTGPPLPVTPTVVERFLQPSDLDTLLGSPENRAALETLLETPEDFARRRVSLAARFFATQQRTATPIELVRRATLTPAEADTLSGFAEEVSRMLRDVLAARAPPPPEWRWMVPGYPKPHAMRDLLRIVDTGIDFRYSFGSEWTQAEGQTMPSPRGGPSNINRRRAEGYGEGEGASYRAWETVRSVSSRGMSHRVWGAKAARQHMLLSDRELWCWYLLEWAKAVIDHREQFPLHELSETQAIAAELGYPHPIRTRKRKGETIVEDKVMTVDFLVTLARPIQGSRYVALSVKTLDELEDPKEQLRTLEKEEIARRYFARRGIPFRFVTEHQLPRMLVENLSLVLHHLDLTGFGVPEGQEAAIRSHLYEQLLSAEGVAMGRVCAGVDERLRLPRGASAAVAWNAIATKQWRVNMRTPLGPDRPLRALVVVTAAARRTA